MLKCWIARDSPREWQRSLYWQQERKWKVQVLLPGGEKSSATNWQQLQESEASQDSICSVPLIWWGKSKDLLLKGKKRTAFQEISYRQNSCSAWDQAAKTTVWLWALPVSRVGKIFYLDKIICWTFQFPIFHKWTIIFLWYLALVKISLCKGIYQSNLCFLRRDFYSISKTNHFLKSIA